MSEEEKNKDYSSYDEEEEEEESSESEEDPNQNINPSLRYLYTLKTQYDQLMKEGELVKQRKLQYENFKIELAKLVDGNGRPKKNTCPPPKILTEFKKKKDAGLQEFEIVVPTYMYEPIALK